MIEFDFSETTTTAAGGISTVNGNSSRTELLYGPYASATLRYDFNKRWGIHLGAQFQNLNDLELSSGSRTARLDQSVTIYGTGGVSYRF